MITQVEIAEMAGLDVSSVNKILNEVPGPIFKKETIARVLKIAAKHGYDFERPTKLTFPRALREVVPAEEPDGEAALRLRVSERRVSEIKRMLYGRRRS